MTEPSGVSVSALADFSGSGVPVTLASGDSVPIQAAVSVGFASFHAAIWARVENNVIQSSLHTQQDSDERCILLIRKEATAEQLPKQIAIDNPVWN